MSIVNFDRDLEYLRLNQGFISLSAEIAWAEPHNTTTDQILNEQDGSVYYYSFSNAGFAFVGACRAIGLHIIGPDLTNGSPYRIQGYTFEESGLFDMYLMHGIGPASISGTDVIIGAIPLVVGHGLIEFDKTVYIRPFEFYYPGGGYEERPLTVFIMYRRTAASPVSGNVSCRLSVQRLGVKPPDYKTANR